MFFSRYGRGRRRKIGLAADLPIDVVGQADAARVRRILKPHGNVDAVAENIVLVDHDIADMDADAECDLRSVRLAAVFGRHRVLDFDGAARCFHRTCKLDQHAVAGWL